MICICGKKMTESEQFIEIEIGDMASECDKQEGYICECGLFLGKSAAVFNGKTYPYWKYSSDDLNKIMKEK